MTHRHLFSTLVENAAGTQDKLHTGNVAHCYGVPLMRQAKLLDVFNPRMRPMRERSLRCFRFNYLGATLLLLRSTRTRCFAVEVVSAQLHGSRSIWYCRTKPPTLATSATPGTEFNWYFTTNPGWNEVCRCHRGLQRIPENLPRCRVRPIIGVTPAAKSCPRDSGVQNPRARKVNVHRIFEDTLTIENPNAEADRTERTCGSPAD